MTYRDILHRLEVCYDKGEARALARLVLEERFGLSLADVMCDKVDELSAEQSDELEDIIQRLEHHEPVQYILGYQDFCGHRFHVESGVLIPRPETEVLISHLTSKGETIFNSLAGNAPLRILDIGTGSGCIAITLKLMYTEATVEAWDVSDDALGIAKDNAERLGADVIFKKVDILEEQSILTNSPFGGSGYGVGLWNAVVSNPPYICQHEAADMDANVLDHEPHLALFVPDDDPLLFYRAIARYGIKTLQPGGHLLFEINRAYGNEVCQLLCDLGYVNVRLSNDQFGNLRIAQAQKPTL